MELISDYMLSGEKRAMLNDLTRRTFWFDFESWVSGGYYTGEYIPYSFEENGRLLANVSANVMRFLQNGEQCVYIQLGTVMTDEEHRRQGLARRLMEQVLARYENADSVYLFANLDALGFYQKIGFEQAQEYRWTLKAAVKRAQSGLFEPLGNSAELRARYREAVRRGAVFSRFQQLNRYGLQMFYTAQHNGVYYSRALDCFAVMEAEGGSLVLSSVVGKENVPLEQVIAHIGTEYDRLTLGFAPLAQDEGLFCAAPYDGADDYRLLYRGSRLRGVEQDRLFFPLFSHA